jgi:hypothetical protein
MVDVQCRLTQHSLPGGLLGLTWAGLAPADRASFAWRLRSVDRQPGFPRFHRVVDTHTMNGCGEIVTINHVRRRASVMRFNLI